MKILLGRRTQVSKLQHNVRRGGESNQECLPTTFVQPCSIFKKSYPIEAQLFMSFKSSTVDTSEKLSTLAPRQQTKILDC